ncbi:MAG: hypothetical protein ACLQM8_23980 [Limisphaerales bacterium]
MKRALLIGLAGAVCLAALSAAIIQGRQLSNLRAEQQRLAAELAGPEASGLPAPPQGQAGGGPGTAPVSLELLRLRGEVTRLSALRLELAPARAENERLRLQLAAAGTNNVPGQALPPGYLRRADARMAGYNTPEDTLQSLLWALHHKDSLRVLQAFAPEAKDGNAIADTLLQGSEAFIGMAVVGKDQLPDGSVMVRVQVAPDAPAMGFRMESIDGQWKIASPP